MSIEDRVVAATDPLPGEASASRARRVIIGFIAATATFIVVALLLIIAITNTDFGRERVRRYAQKILQGAADHGIVRIGRVEGNLLTGFTLIDASITDSAHVPLVVADTARVRYAIKDLVQKKIVLRDVKLVHPLIVLSQYDDKMWNYKRIFTTGKKPATADTNPHFGSWISFRNVQIIRGTLVVRAAWHPRDTLHGAQRDSAINVALSGARGFRFNVVRQGDTSFRRISEFHDIDGHLPLIRLKDPTIKFGRVEIDSLRMLAMPFRPPSVQVLGGAGALEFNGDSVWWHDVRARLPGTTAAASGFYGFQGSNMLLTMRGSPVALADVRFVQPTIPSKGTATLDFSMRWTDTTETYAAKNAEAVIPNGPGGRDTRLAGSFGITFFEKGDSLLFHDVDGQVANLDVKTAKGLVPALTFPWSGALTGRAKVNGPMGKLGVDADVTLDEPRSGRSRVIALGGMGWNTQKNVFSASNLRLRFEPARVGLAKQFTASVPVGGAVHGTATLDGSTASSLRATLDLTHVDSGRTSRVAGRGSMQIAGPRSRFDFDGRLLPLSLAEVGSLAPAAGLRGQASGPLKVRGTLGDLQLNAKLAVASGGRIDADGRFDLASRDKGYDFSSRMYLFDANAVLDRAPRTSITARFVARGRGFAPGTMNATIGADLAASTLDTLSLDSAHVRLAIADGVARVDTALVLASGARAVVTGTLGLVAERSGELRYEVHADTLHNFARFLPKTDTTNIAPRPRRAAHALAEARRDSAIVAAKSEVARAAVAGITARPVPVKIQVDTPTAVRGDSVAGSLYAAGTVTGSIKDFDLRGRLAAANLVVRGSSTRALRAEYAWNHAPAATSAMIVAANLDSATVAGFALDSVTVRGSMQNKQGKIAVNVVQEPGQVYGLNGDFALHTDHSELHLRDAALQFDSTRWTTTHASAVRWGPQGLQVDKLEMTNAHEGRIYVDGRYLAEGPSNLDVSVDNFQVGDVAALLQSDIGARGLVSLRATLEGPNTAPKLRGAIGLVQGSYNGSEIPNARGTFRYADKQLTSHVEAVTPTTAIPLIAADAQLAIDLGANPSGPRLPRDAPLDVHITGDSLPLGLIPQFTDLVRDVSGRAAGNIRVRGTLEKPAIAGALALLGGTVRVVPVGVLFHDVGASIRVAGDTVVVDSIVGVSGGRVFVRGGIGIKEISKPAFDLYLVAQNARVLDNEQGRVRADAGLALKGAIDRAYVSGRVGVRSGVIYIPESNDKKIIGATDPALFAVVDTSLAQNRDLVPGESPLLQNLRMDVTVDVARDTWVRSKDANVEIFTPPGEELLIHVNRRRSALTLEGAVSTDRGEYEFLSRRFQIRQGTATFVGTPGLNPNLQITAENQVAVTSREAVNIRVVIGGTLDTPKLSLESDAQPPIAQSDLLAYLAFGRSSSSLLQLGGSSVGGGSSGSSSLAGAGAGLVGQQLAAVALGVFVDEFEGQASRSLGADVFNITPADVYTELSRGSKGIASFFKSTEVEAGKYTDPNTFVAVTARPSLFSSNKTDRAVPGISMQRRSSKGFRIEASYQPRYILLEPTLEEQTAKSTGVFGLFLIREWRF